MKSGKAEVARERFGEPLAREDREPGEKEEMREESTKVGYSMARVIARRHVRNARCKCDREKKRGGRKGGRRRRETQRKRERGSKEEQQREAESRTSERTCRGG